MNYFLIFSLAAQHYGLPLTFVDKVERMVEISPLPGAPDTVYGFINYHGAPVAVLNTRSRFQLPAREIALSDQLIFLKALPHRLALIVDAIYEVMPAQEMTDIDAAMPDNQLFTAIIERRGDIIFIHNPAKFFSITEEQDLINSLVKLQHHGAI